LPERFKELGWDSLPSEFCIQRLLWDDLPKSRRCIQDAAARARGEILPVASEDRIVLFSSIK
jgi:hypothetical protein